MQVPHITSIYRYPVKGMSPERLSQAALTPGATLPLDRAYAIENGPGPFDAAAPRHLPKVTFLCLMRNEILASLQTVLDTSEGSHALQINRGLQRLASGDLKTPEGKAVIEAYFAGEMAADLRGRPKVVSADGHSFSDVKEKCLHIVNLATVRALGQAMGRPIDPLRFRANVYVDGLDAWAELDAIGCEISTGAARLMVFKRTLRCAATEVDPATGARDAAVPDAIAALAGHRDLGIYAMVTAAGTIRSGDVLTGWPGLAGTGDTGPGQESDPRT